jgi:hydroxymethylpyrimidine pyrophosphatase-like HAD family hydrolase
VRYDLLAIDLDGTLLNSRGRVSEGNREAIRDARARGLATAICTGRGLAECREILDGIGQHDPVVVAGGSLVADPADGATLHRFAMSTGTVAGAVSRVNQLGYAAAVLKDSHHTGYEYLVVGGEDRHEIHPVNAWWFDRMRVRVREVGSLDEDEHPDHTVRVGVCGWDEHMGELLGVIYEEFAEHANMHQFGAVVALPAGGSERVGGADRGDLSHSPGASDDAGRRVNILELFHRDAGKWNALSWIASSRSIDRARIAAIGDEINDVCMIQGAALGIAMDNAISDIHEIADKRAPSNDEDGVAYAIERILSGAW